MNETEARRKKIIEILKESHNPIKGSSLAERYGVSRQVIVQDIAILKAENYKIISTNRGYKLFTEDNYSRVIKVSHDDNKIREELNEIVDRGAVVKDVFVWHKAYGKILVDLNIKSRRDIDKLIFNIEAGISKPLKKLTEDYHYHTIVADSEEILDEIEESLKKLNILV
ncbi:MAG: transcription repressor NadR [Peptoniphilaceae bacterium]